MTTKALLLAASLLVVGAVPAHAQNFLMNSAETINKGNFKIAGFPTVLLGENGADNEWGIAARLGYGFTPSFDVEAKVAFFDGFKLYGVDAELWLVKGELDVSVAAGAHRADFDFGPDSTAIDASGWTKKLPGCGSAWKKPRSSTSCRNMRTAFRAIARRGTCSRSRAESSVTLTPPTRSRVSTRAVVCAQWTRGIHTEESPANAWPRRSALWPSRT